jgi:hypothetical protein
MPHEREETVARLREAVEQTRALYEGAKNNLEVKRELARDLGPAHPDGGLSHALKIYTYTLTNYHSALRRFNRFVLDGKLPDDES